MLEDCWKHDEKKGPLRRLVPKYIARNRWEQLDRFFHVSPTPPPHEGAERQNFFEQLEPLSENPGFSFKRYWERGTHVAIDETIQRFTGRTEETVNIPSKPVPEGFKIRVLANQGYVLDWLYHAKG